MFACPSISESMKARIESHTRRRFGVIDRFLNEQFGASWSQRSRIICSETALTQRKNLWEFALQSNVLLRLHKARQLESIFPDLTVDSFQFESDTYKLCLLGSSKVVTDDLATAWHPQFHGRNVFPSCTDFSDASRRTRQAIELLEPYPDFTDLILNECGAVCFISSAPDMEEGQCISLASKMVPGLIYVSPTSPILLAESLVHESAHLRFRALEEVTDLYSDGPNMLVKTPLRPDPRPISGLMHQLVVLRYLAALYEKLRTSNEMTISRQRQQVEKRFHRHLQDLEAGKYMARNVMPALTSDGRRLLDMLLEDPEPILSDQND